MRGFPTPTASQNFPRTLPLIEGGFSLGEGSSGTRGTRNTEGLTVIRSPFLFGMDGIIGRWRSHISSWSIYISPARYTFFDGGGNWRHLFYAARRRGRAVIWPASTQFQYKGRKFRCSYRTFTRCRCCRISRGNPKFSKLRSILVAYRSRFTKRARCRCKNKTSLLNIFPPNQV